MAAASRSLATALSGSALRERLALPQLHHAQGHDLDIHCPEIRILTLATFETVKALGAEPREKADSA